MLSCHELSDGSKEGNELTHLWQPISLDGMEMEPNGAWQPQAPKTEPAGELGTLDPTGRIMEVPVVLQARTCKARMRISAVALASTLIAGHAQHLGLILHPLHDTLQEGSLHVDPVDPSAGDLTPHCCLLSPTFLAVTLSQLGTRQEAWYQQAMNLWQPCLSMGPLSPMHLSLTFLAHHISLVLTHALC